MTDEQTDKVKTINSLNGNNKKQQYWCNLKSENGYDSVIMHFLIGIVCEKFDGLALNLSSGFSFLHGSISKSVTLFSLS